jgi:hypothetical protein
VSAVSVLEVPRRLPVRTLSATSIACYLRCPELWRRRYIEHEYEPTNGAMVLGAAVHAAEAQADSLQIETGERPGGELTQDAFADEWEDRTERQEVAYGNETKGALKDAGVGVLRAYDRDIAPHLQPVSSEREFRLTLPGVDWGFVGYIDLEEASGAIVDRKVVKRRKSQAEADSELQVAPYLLTRQAEGNPASRLEFHTMVHGAKPYAEVVPTTRTERQLDAFVERLYRIAAEVAWRLDTGNWAGAPPGSWWCSERFCAHWHRCPMGGAV